MNDDGKAKTEFHEGGVKGFFSSLLLGLVRDAVKLIVAFAVGTLRVILSLSNEMTKSSSSVPAISCSSIVTILPTPCAG